MTTKTRNLRIHEGNYNRRVNYNDRKEFEVLIINLQDGIIVQIHGIGCTKEPEEVRPGEKGKRVIWILAKGIMVRIILNYALSGIASAGM